MKFYLAAMYSRRDELREHARQLRAMGHIVTSGWLRERDDLSGDLVDSPAIYRDRAERDLNDIRMSEALIYFTEDPNVGIKRGGRHFEAGFAVGIGKSLYIIGPRENIFCYDRQHKQFERWEDFIAWLKMQQN